MEGCEALAHDPTRLEHPPDTGDRPGTHPPCTAILDTRPPDREASLSVLSCQRVAFVQAAPGHSTEHSSLVWGRADEITPSRKSWALGAEAGRCCSRL